MIIAVIAIILGAIATKYGIASIIAGFTTIFDGLNSKKKDS